MRQIRASLCEKPFRSRYRRTEGESDFESRRETTTVEGREEEEGRLCAGRGADKEEEQGSLAGVRYGCGNYAGNPT